MRLFGDYAAEPDCLVRATPAALLSMALAEHREDEVFSGAVKIDGDNGLAQAIGDVFKGLDIDWEEQLALVWRQFRPSASAIRRAPAAAGPHSTQTLQAPTCANTSSRKAVSCPSEMELQGFLDGVDRLRDDVERSRRASSDSLATPRAGTVRAE